MTLFRCKHKRLSLPVSERRRCLDCPAEFEYTTLTLTAQDRAQGSTITTQYDNSALKRVHKGLVVRTLRRREAK